MKKRAAILAVIVAALSGCSQQVSLIYVPTGVYTTQAQPVIGQVTAVDQRGESDPTWIGAVRGGYGNPLKVLHASRPVADIVADVFRQALLARGLLSAAGSGTAELAVTVVRLQSSQYVRREGDVDFIIEIRETATGRQIYRDEVSANPVQGSVFALNVGVFGSVDDLQSLAQGAMNQAVDAALKTSPGF